MDGDDSTRWVASSSTNEFVGGEVAEDTEFTGVEIGLDSRRVKTARVEVSDPDRRRADEWTVCAAFDAPETGTFRLMFDSPCSGSQVRLYVVDAHGANKFIGLRTLQFLTGGAAESEPTEVAESESETTEVPESESETTEVAESESETTEEVESGSEAEESETEEGEAQWTATAASSFHGEGDFDTFSFVNAVDGDAETAWVADTPTDAWIQFDAGVTVTYTEATLTPESSKRMRNCRIAALVDDEWVTVATFEAPNSSNVLEIDFETEASARHWRLYIDDTHGANKNAGVAEVVMA